MIPVFAREAEAERKAISNIRHSSPFGDKPPDIQVRKEDSAGAVELHGGGGYLGFGVGGAVVFDDGGEEEVAGGNEVEGMPESTAVVSEVSHEPGEESAAGDAGAGE
jgi:hypothetical protein